MRDPWLIKVVKHSDKDEILFQSRFTSAFAPLTQQSEEDLTEIIAACEREMDRRATDAQRGADS